MLGALLLFHAERWPITQGAQLLQVKTIASASPNPHYAQTRAYFERIGFAAIKGVPELRGPWNPCLQVVKAIDSGKFTHGE